MLEIHRIRSLMTKAIVRNIVYPYVRHITGFGDLWIAWGSQGISETIDNNRMETEFSRTPKVDGRTVQGTTRLDIQLKNMYIFDTNTYVNIGQK